MQVSYSSEGEDILIWRLLHRLFPMDDPEKGTYVDVGAYHPHTNSNTKLLFEAGWSGMNIDPRKDSMEAFEKDRPNDVNLEVACGATERDASYHEFDRDELNGLTAKAQFQRGALWQRTYEVPVRPLSKLLQLHGFETVDFLNIDTEGHEQEVLNGMDWTKRPKIIAIEHCEWPISWQRPGPFRTLDALRYRMTSKLHCTYLFVDSERAVFR